MKVKEVQSCSFENWYETFKSVTIKSIIIPIPGDFISYILKDGIVLPKNSQTYSVPECSDTSDDEETNWDDGDTVEPEAPHFPDFDEKIKDSIKRLGGKVFPKLNWSSPRDASWIGLNSSCCCYTVSDVYLLLKSSNFIIHDITQRYDLCDDYDSGSVSGVSLESQKYFVVLRRWTDIDTSGEFRCFVKDNDLIGICQREHSAYYDHIDLHKSEIIEDILCFFKEKIHSKFSCSSYVFDVYRKKKEKVYLIDFNPFGAVTDSLLYTWEDLKNGSIKCKDGIPQFRFVEDNFGVQPNTLSHLSLPTDIFDITSGNDSFKLVDLLRLKIDEQKKDASDESEEDWKV